MQVIAPKGIPIIYIYIILSNSFILMLYFGRDLPGFSHAGHRLLASKLGSSVPRQLAEAALGAEDALLAAMQADRDDDREMKN